MGIAEKLAMSISRRLTTRPLVGEGNRASESAVETVRVRVLPDGRMTREDAARYLGHAAKTLAMWQLAGKGPRSVLVGGRRFYFKDDLDRFVRGETP
jgi:anti-sigma-K factor RskA